MTRRTPQTTTGDGMNANLPALPGGVGSVSDTLAALSGRIAESEDILADYRAVLASARQNGISIPRDIRKEARAAMRPIARLHAVARLQLQVAMLAIGYGEKTS